MVEKKGVSVHLGQAICQCPINECIDASYFMLNLDDVTLPTLANDTVEVVSFPTALVTNHDDVWTSEETLSMPKDLFCHGMDPAPGVVITGNRPNVTAASCYASHTHMRRTSSSHLAWSDIDDSIGQAWVCNKNAKIWHILLCPLYSMYSSGWILSILGTNNH